MCISGMMNSLRHLKGLARFHNKIPLPQPHVRTIHSEVAWFRKNSDAGARVGGAALNYRRDHLVSQPVHKIRKFSTSEALCSENDDDQGI